MWKMMCAQIDNQECIIQIKSSKVVVMQVFCERVSAIVVHMLKAIVV